MISKLPATYLSIKSPLYWKHSVILVSEAGGIFVLLISKSPVVYSICELSSDNSLILVTNTGLDERFVTVTSKYTFDHMVVSLQSNEKVPFASKVKVFNVTSLLACTLCTLVIRTSALDLTSAAPLIAKVLEDVEYPTVSEVIINEIIKKRNNGKLFFFFLLNFFIFASISLSSSWHQVYIYIINYHL